MRSQVVPVDNDAWSSATYSDSEFLQKRRVSLIPEDSYKERV